MPGGSTPLDLDEWDQVLGKMHRLHDNIQKEVATIIQTIRKEMKQELVPLAEEKANYGKVVKHSIREMWALEYEIADIQAEFNNSCLANLDINSLTDDIVEDIMLQSKPLQVILLAIRNRQKIKCEAIKKEYADHITGLEPLKITRPPKPEPEAPPPKEEKKEAEPPAAPPPETAPMTQVSA
jgi:hypothetical protein